MIFARVIGWSLIAFALIVAGSEILNSLEEGAWRPLAAGLLWYKISPGGINFTQAIVQRYLHPTLWDPVIIAILQTPAWVVLGLPGLILLLYCRKERAEKKKAKKKKKKTRLDRTTW